MHAYVMDVVQLHVSMTRSVLYDMLISVSSCDA